MKIQLRVKEVVRPKGTVVTLFDMQNFISCVHLV